MNEYAFRAYLCMMEPEMTNHKTLLKNERVELLYFNDAGRLRFFQNDAVLDLSLDGLLSDNNDFKLFSIALLSIYKSIITCTYEGQAKALFLEAKSLELMALYIAALAQPKQNYVYCKSEYDRERLFFAKAYLSEHYYLAPTIVELARIAGINEYKLKNGFKELFGDTIHNYVNNYRLDMALQMLSTSGKKANQLAFDLGFSSLQHFSKSFRKKFGYPPNQVNKPIPGASPAHLF